MTSITIPMRLPSVANLSEFWATKARRAKAQRDAVTLAMRNRINPDFSGVMVVTLVRCAPRQLDDDNNVSAMKACRDSVAAYFGLDDRSPRLRFECRQEKAKQASVRIEFRAEAT